MKPKKLTLTFEDRTVTVEKLALRRISEVFKALDQLPKKIAGIDFENMKNEQFIEVLPGIIGDILPEVAKIIAIGSDLDEKQVLDELGLAEAIEILAAIFKVNDLNKIVDNVKKLMARKPQADNKLTTGSTEPLIS